METKVRICPRCLREYGIDPDLWKAVCKSCEPLYPPSLLKACEDFFDYVIGLRGGETFRFASAEIHGDYVHLDFGGHPQDTEWRYCFDHGVDVRLGEIAWCADAPEGS
jgi:hypothetical protein